MRKAASSEGEYFGLDGGDGLARDADAQAELRLRHLSVVEAERAHLIGDHTLGHACLR
jgi:hypothetical protein